MKNVALYSVIFFCALVFTSCNQDDDSPEPSSPSNTEIVFGDSESSQITKYEYDPPREVSSTENGGEVRDTIDLSVTSGADFVLISYGSHWANSKMSSLSSINSDLEFLIDPVRDTIFKTNHSLLGLILDSNVVWNSNSMLDPLTNDYEIVQNRIENLVIPFEEGQYISAGIVEGQWSQTGTFSRYLNGYSSLPDPLDGINYFNYIRVGNWNSDIPTPHYVVFRYRTNGSYKYGWLKIAITNNFKITIYEIAY